MTVTKEGSAVRPIVAANSVFTVVSSSSSGRKGVSWSLAPPTMTRMRNFPSGDLCPGKMLEVQSAPRIFLFSTFGIRYPKPVGGSWRSFRSYPTPTIAIGEYGIWERMELLWGAASCRIPAALSAGVATIIPSASNSPLPVRTLSLPLTTSSWLTWAPVWMCSPMSDARRSVSWETPSLKLVRTPPGPEGPEDIPYSSPLLLAFFLSAAMPNMALVSPPYCSSSSVMRGKEALRLIR